MIPIVRYRYLDILISLLTFVGRAIHGSWCVVGQTWTNVKHYRRPVSMESVLTTRAAIDVNAIWDLLLLKTAGRASVSV